MQNQLLENWQDHNRARAEYLARVAAMMRAMGWRPPVAKRRDHVVVYLA